MKAYKINNNIREQAAEMISEKWSWRNVLVVIVALVICFVYVKEKMYTCVYVDGKSMLSTLHDGDWLLIDMMSEIHRGDVIVFYNESTDNLYIKRVIGLPGDKIWTSGGIVHRIKAGSAEEEVLEEDYVKEGCLTWRTARDDGNDLKTVTVGEGRLFVLGDNREDSTDSRSGIVGTVPLENVKGVVHQSIIDNKDDLWFLYRLL